MRVTAETKAATRKRILQAARRLFAGKGYEQTTTRDIAELADIASGTLFNYFPAKEAIVECLANEAMDEVLAQVDAADHADNLEEDLFGLVAAALRKLKRLRRHLPSLLETSLSPLNDSPRDGSASFRTGHLEVVAALAARHGYGELPPTALQLYWTLYTGVLVFWANDNSPKQEDTLALIDASLNMFVGWLRAQSPPTSDASEPIRS
jgi:AcrR family transcriptional regulator